MTTVLPSYSETDAAHSHVDLALTIELEPDSATALMRTLVLLHRRRCRVTEAGYRSGIDRCDRLDVRVQAPPTHAHCVPAWLSALVEVRRVIAVSPPAANGRPRGRRQLP
jgi:hypothetical protein